jgi:hypothetical protein
MTVKDPQALSESGPNRAEKTLSPAARRALAEAEERRLLAKESPARPKEINGPEGPEPTRYGDWAIKGIASDF